MSRGRFPIGDLVPFTAPPYGLLSVATEIQLPGGTWQRGLIWEDYCPASAVTADPCNTIIDDGTGTAEPLDIELFKPPTTEHELRGSTSFTVFNRIDCSPPGAFDELPGRAQTALLESEGRAVERMFWTGVPTAIGAEVIYPHLAADNTLVDGRDLLQEPATVVTTTPQQLDVAIGMLEDAIRDCYTGVPTLHIPLRFSSLLASYTQVDKRSRQMTTNAGSKVVLGGGYPGTGPDGTQTEGQEWIYATGEVFYARDQVHRFSAVDVLDRSSNTVHALAERTYTVGYECCLFTIPVDTEEVTA